jgi:hypothetical protein
MEAFPVTNMWQVYTRPTSASDFLLLIFKQIIFDGFLGLFFEDLGIFYLEKNDQKIVWAWKI